MICANIGAEWITQTIYVFSDASARVHGQGYDMSVIVRSNTYGFLWHILCPVSLIQNMWWFSLCALWWWVGLYVALWWLVGCSGGLHVCSLMVDWPSCLLFYGVSCDGGFTWLFSMWLTFVLQYDVGLAMWWLLFAPWDGWLAPCVLNVHRFSCRCSVRWYIYIIQFSTKMHHVQVLLPKL